MSVHEYILWDRLGQSINMVGIHVQVDMYTERGGRDIIGGTYGEYLYTGGD